jgi:hypothetical protein
MEEGGVMVKNIWRPTESEGNFREDNLLELWKDFFGH